MRRGELGQFNVSIMFFHCHRKVNSVKGGVNDIWGKKLNKGMKPVYINEGWIKHVGGVLQCSIREECQTQ
jgi:hypothetical protein